MSKIYHIFISAGEISGDMYGGMLAKSIKEKLPHVKLTGMGHVKMRAAGVDTICDLAAQSTVGIFEPLKYLPQIFGALGRLFKHIKKSKPDLVVVIDFQGFHMMLLKKIKTLGVPTVYFIAPQEWQWGSEKGGRKVGAVSDLILSIFEPEAQFYQSLGVKTCFVGHPILDLVSVGEKKLAFFARHQLVGNKRILGVFPGSRVQEVKHLLPVFLSAAKAIRDSLGNDVEIFVSCASDHLKKRILAEIKVFAMADIVTLYEGASRDLIANSDLSLTSSGTITLEHVVLGIPMIVGYRFHRLSFFLIKLLFKKTYQTRIKFLSLPNIYMDKEIHPEFLQDDCNLHNLTQVGVNLLRDPIQVQKIKQGYQGVRKMLGDKGAIDRARDAILGLVN